MSTLISATFSPSTFKIRLINPILFFFALGASSIPLPNLDSLLNPSDSESRPYRPNDAIGSPDDFVLLRHAVLACEKLLGPVRPEWDEDSPFSKCVQDHSANFMAAYRERPFNDSKYTHATLAREKLGDSGEAWLDENSPYERCVYDLLGLNKSIEYPSQVSALKSKIYYYSSIHF